MNRLSNWIILVVAVAFSLGGLELATRSLDLFPELRAAVDRAATATAEEVERSRPRLLLHPYRGWSGVPGQPGGAPGSWPRFFPAGKPTPWALANSTHNLFGVTSHLEDYRDLGEDRFVVGIFGGSVSALLATLVGDIVQTRLAARFPSLKGQIEILNMANGGHKQPQQLQALLELVMLGVPLDLVINIDGFNEVAFGGFDAGRGHHPYFPIHGRYAAVAEVTSDLPSEETIETRATIQRNRRAARRLASRLSSTLFLRRSEAVKAAAGYRITDLERRVLGLEQELGEVASTVRAPRLPGLPDECLAQNRDCWPLVTDLWANGSRLMHAVARSIGAEYMHLLQPNQYLPGSKELSADERARALDESSAHARLVPQGYPLLRERGRQLRAEGIAFHDLTQIFAVQSETIYIDDCCHYNLQGSRLLAQAIVSRVRGPNAGRQPRETRPEGTD